MAEENCDEIHLFLKQFGLLEYDTELRAQGLENLQIMHELEGEDIEEIITDAKIKKSHVETLTNAINAVKDGTYTCNTNKEEEEEYKYITIGKAESDMKDENNKTIIFIGESGVGKTTVINSMCNYLYNVKYNDKIRYKLPDEAENKSNETQSRTQSITSYYLNKLENINYSLTVIDSPGYGNSTENDSKLKNELKKCFSDHKFIDAIYFVVKSTETRLTDLQKYLFTTIYKLFYNIDNIKNNIFILFTFSDGSVPPAIQCVKELDFEHNETCFKINNSGFTLPDNGNGSNETHKMYYNLGIKQFELIFNELNKATPQPTKQIVQNIDEVMDENPNGLYGVVDDDDDIHNDEKEPNYKNDIREIKFKFQLKIEFDKNRYIIVKDINNGVCVLYNVLVHINKKIVCNFHLTINQIATFHSRKIRGLAMKSNQTNDIPQFEKFNPRYDFEKTSITCTNNKIRERIDKLNTYVKQLSKFITNSSQSLQEAFFNFFHINTFNSLYKYISNDNVEILSELHKYNNTLLVEFIDRNKSNIFHYIVSRSAINVLKWILNKNIINNKELISKLLNAKDQYNITPITLAKYIKKESICNLVNKYNEQKEEKEEKINILPYQYQYKKKKRKFCVVISQLSNAKAIWKDFVQKFLDYNKIEYQVYIKKGEIETLIKQCQNISFECVKFDIVCIGGDGIIGKMLNGLCNNNNNKNKNICITPIACGECNGLAKELNLENITIALRKLLNGFETCIHSYKFITSQKYENDTYAFVSTQWATIAKTGRQIKKRSAISEIAWSRNYKATIYFKESKTEKVEKEQDFKKYKPINAKELQELIIYITQNKNYEIKVSEWKCIEGKFQLLCVTNLQWIAEQTNMGGKGFDAQTNALRLVYNTKVQKSVLDNTITQLRKGKHLELDHVYYNDIQEVVIVPDEKTKDPPIRVDAEKKPVKAVYIKLLPADFVVTF